MNGNEYVRALLYAYPKMKMLADAVREGARVRAVLSFRFPRDTLSRMEGIAADMEYAERLLVWKGELDHILSGCDEVELFLLEYKYFRRRRVLDSMNKDGALSCSERSYFRHQNAVLEKVAGALIRRGCTKEAFYSDFEGFSPVMRIVSALEKGWERKVVARRKDCGLSFAEDQKSSVSAGAGAFLPRRTKNAIAATASMPATSAAISIPESEASGSGAGAGVSSAGPAVSVR